MSVSRQDLARLKKLLLARDVDLVQQGVEFVAAMDEPELWSTLLSGVSYRSEKNATGYTAGAFVPNRMFTGTGPAQPFHDLALMLLVANSPMQELKDQVVALFPVVYSGGYRGTNLTRLPLEGIERFTNLEHFALYALPSEPIDLSPLGEAPALRVLSIRGNTELSLAGLGRSKTLERLEIMAPLETTSGIEGAPVESVLISSRTLKDLRGLDGTKVKTLNINGAAVLDASALSRCKHLVTADLQAYTSLQLSGIGGCPVETLRIRGPLAAPLPPLHALRDLTMPLAGRSQPQPVLTTLSLYDDTDTGPRIATSFPALTRLDLNRIAGDAEFLRGATSLQTLLLRRCELTDTSALGTLMGLVTLGIDSLRCAHLDSLPEATLADADGKPTHTLYLAHSDIRSIKGVGRLKGVQVLSLQSCEKLSSLEGLEGSEIRGLDLRGCANLSDVSALGEMPELRCVALRGTAFHENNVPEGVAGAVTLSQNVNIESAIHRPKPSATKRKTTIPVPKEQRERWEAMQPLLAIVDPAGVERLVTFLLGSGTEEIFDVLLKGVSATARDFTVRGRLLDADRWVRELLVQRLVGVGKGKEVERLALSRTHWHALGHQAGDLRGVGRFLNLESLQFGTDQAARGLDELSALPSLHTLVVDGAQPLDDLGPLPALKTLTVWRSATKRLDFVPHALNLTSLSLFGTALTDISGLADHKKLSHLQFATLAGVKDLRPLATLGAAANLSLGICPKLPSLAALSRLESLSLSPDKWPDTGCLAGLRARHLNLTPTGPLPLLGLDALPALQTLEIGAGVTRLQQLPKKLQKLTVRGISDLSDLPEMELDTLQLYEIDDFDFVERVRGLRVLMIDPPYGKTLPDLAPLQKARDLTELHIVPNGPTSLSALRGHPSLKRIVTASWRRSYLQIPDEMLGLLQ